MEFVTQSSGVESEFQDGQLYQIYNCLQKLEDWLRNEENSAKSCQNVSKLIALIATYGKSISLNDFLNGLAYRNMSHLVHYLSLCASHVPDDQIKENASKLLTKTENSLASKLHCTHCGVRKLVNISCNCETKSYKYVLPVFPGLPGWKPEWNGVWQHVYNCMKTAHYDNRAEASPFDSINQLLSTPRFAGRIEANDAVGQELFGKLQAKSNEVQHDVKHSGALYSFVIRPWQVTSTVVSTPEGLCDLIKRHKPEESFPEYETKFIDIYLTHLMELVSLHHSDHAEDESHRVSVEGVSVSFAPDGYYNGIPVEFKTVRNWSNIEHKLEKWMHQIAVCQLGNGSTVGYLGILYGGRRDELVKGQWINRPFRLYEISVANIAFCQANWKKWFATLAPEDLDVLRRYSNQDISYTAVLNYLNQKKEATRKKYADAEAQTNASKGSSSKSNKASGFSALASDSDEEEGGNEETKANEAEKSQEQQQHEEEAA